MKVGQSPLVTPTYMHIYIRIAHHAELAQGLHSIALYSVKTKKIRQMISVCTI